MARGRMINKTVAVDQALSLFGAEAGAWGLVAHHRMIAFLDVRGNIRCDEHWLKATLFPHDTSVSAGDCREIARLLAGHGLAVAYRAQGLDYLHFPAFAKNQSGLRPDKERPEFPDISEKDEVAKLPGNSPEASRQSSAQLPANSPGKQKGTKLNRTEEKETAEAVKKESDKTSQVNSNEATAVLNLNRKPIASEATAVLTKLDKESINEFLGEITDALGTLAENDRVGIYFELVNHGLPPRQTQLDILQELHRSRSEKRAGENGLSNEIGRIRNLIKEAAGVLP